MAIATPLQIVVSRDGDDRRTDVYVDTLRLAFEGRAEAASSPSAYLADAVDLGVRVLEPATDIDEAEIGALVGGAKETVVVVIGDESAQSAALEGFVGPERMVRVESPPAGAGAVQAARSGSEEYAFAPVVTTLRTMERARGVLAARIAGTVEGTSAGVLKLFISHAKTDGVAMARSLIGVLHQLQEADPAGAGFQYFYDAEHIPPGTVWREVLEAQASESVLIALRTEAYESRYWCRRGVPVGGVERYADCCGGSAEGAVPRQRAASVRGRAERPGARREPDQGGSSRDGVAPAGVARGERGGGDREGASASALGVFVGGGGPGECRFEADRPPGAQGAGCL